MTSLPDSTSQPITVGIDVAKDTLEVALGQTAATLSVNNTPEGIDSLLTRLSGCQIALVVLEATGGLESPVACAL
jgi:transposase